MIYYLLGVGGMGMQALAFFLKERGDRVIGFDDNLSSEARGELLAAGIEIQDGLDIHSSIDMLVYSTAINSDHVGLSEANRLGLPTALRGDFIANELKGKKVIAITGSHGKSSATAMAIHVLGQLGFPCGYLLGATFRDSSKRSGHYDASSDWVLTELDESDGTWLGFEPEITLALNFDWDHTTTYNTKQSLKDAFLRLFSQTKQKVLYVESDLTLKALIETSAASSSSFDSSAAIQLPKHLWASFNALNASSVFAICHELGLSPSSALFKSYKGISRRQDILFSKDSFTVISDYAHHPTEVEALIESARRTYFGKLVVVFQPHRYSRTKHYSDAFARALSKANVANILPVYSAGEQFDSEGTAAAIMDHFEDASKARLIKDKHALDSYLSAVGRHSGVLLFIGAGDIHTWAKEYVAELDTFELEALSLSEHSIFKQNEPIGSKTTLKVGGQARYYAEPATIKDLQYLLKESCIQKVETFMLGRGSNVIVSDSGFDGLVIRLNHPSWRSVEYLGNGYLKVMAGARLSNVCAMACKLGLGGFEFLEGIPGSLGGALRMNAGAMGGWMYDVVDSVEFVTQKGLLRKLPKDSLSIRYRSCDNFKEATAVSAILCAKEVGLEPESIQEKISTMATHRKSSQPREASAGCIFKNPESGYAGKMIDELGFKGANVGQARISDVHANFIVNKGNASSEEILGLIKKIRQDVYDKSGVYLEPEVLLLGDQWESILEGS